MQTLNKTKILNLAKAVLGIHAEEDDDRIEALLEFVVADIVDEFTGDIGIKTRDDLVVSYIASTDTSPAYMYITMPEDLLYPIAVWVGTTEITPQTSADFLRYSKVDVSTEHPIISRPVRKEDGSYVLELYPINATLANSRVQVVYKSSSEDVTIIPYKYRRLVIYGIAKEYYLFSMLEDPAVESKFNARYEKAKGQLARDELNAKYPHGVQTETLNEKRWKESFNIRSLSNAADIRR